MSMFNSKGKGQVLFFFIMSVTTTIASNFHCCYPLLVPNNFMPALLQSFLDDLLITILSFPWLIFNLASWAILYVVTILIFLKCHCNLFASNSKAINDNTPRVSLFTVSFHFSKLASAVPHEPCLLAWLVLLIRVWICLGHSHRCFFCCHWSSHPPLSHLYNSCVSHMDKCRFLWGCLWHPKPTITYPSFKSFGTRIYCIPQGILNIL